MQTRPTTLSWDYRVAITLPLTWTLLND
jgi:hypothetical protein